MYSITEAAVNRKRPTDKHSNAFPSYICLPAPVIKIAPVSRVAERCVICDAKIDGKSTRYSRSCCCRGTVKIIS